MKRFIDATGKQWEFDINVETVEKVKSICKTDLTQLFNEDLGLLGAMFEDPCQLASILWALVGPLDGDKSAFLRAMKGDALEAAATALIEDVIDFFQNPRQRQLCRDAVKKLQETISKVQDLQEKKLLDLDPTSLASVIASQESPESKRAA